MMDAPEFELLLLCHRARHYCGQRNDWAFAKYIASKPMTIAPRINNSARVDGRPGTFPSFAIRMKIGGLERRSSDASGDASGRSPVALIPLSYRKGTRSAPAQFLPEHGSHLQEMRD